MKNLSKEKRDRLLFISGGTVALILVIWFVLINSQRKSIETIAKQIVDQKNKVGSAERLITTSAEITNRKESAQKKLLAIEEGMASGDMYSWIIQTLNKFCIGRKVDIPQFSREVMMDVGVLPKFPYKAAVFNIRGTAYFHDLGKFVADFENAFPFIRLQNIEMEQINSSGATAAGNLGDPEKLAFRMEIVTLINPQAH